MSLKNRHNLFVGDSLSVLQDKSKCREAQCIVTSPPYIALREYGDSDIEVGKKDDMAQYISDLVNIFNACPLKEDGNLWVNIGDSWNKNGCLKGAPERFMLAMMDAGWMCRQRIIWHKSSSIPEPSVITRPHNEIEMIYLFAKTKKTKWRWESCAVPLKECSIKRREGAFNEGKYHGSGAFAGGEGIGIKMIGVNHKYLKTPLFDNAGIDLETEKDKITKERKSKWKYTRALRNCWLMGTSNIRDKHYAPYPEELVRRCVLLSTDEDDVVLDPFAGSCTTAIVAQKFNRQSDCIELYPHLATIAGKRFQTETGEKLQIS